MPAISRKAPGKIILCGEHAVVYGAPAIALPVFQVYTRTGVMARPTAPQSEVRIIAPSVEVDSSLSTLTPEDPLRAAVELVMKELGIQSMPACEIRISSTVPVAAGLGSSASVTISLTRALSDFLGHPLEDEAVNRIAYEVEKIHHGTPSGIDNTVITYQVPVLFQKSSGLRRLNIAHDMTLVIADSGLQSSTADAVAGVRQRWTANPDEYEESFKRIGEISTRVAEILEKDALTSYGYLLSENHQILCQMGVSSLWLDELVTAALKAGAFGAKLSGGGIGGNIIALVTPDSAEAIAGELMAKGAVQTIITTIPASTGTSL